MKPLEVHIKPEQHFAFCPACNGLWDRDKNPRWHIPQDERIAPTGPYCPHCGATVLVIIDLPTPQEKEATHGR